MSPEKEKSNKSKNPIDIMCRKCEEYGWASEMISRGHSKEEDGFNEKANRLEPEIIKLTADNLVKAKPTEREKIIGQAIGSMKKGLGSYTDHIVINFVENTLLRVLDITTSDKEELATIHKIYKNSPN